jgi:hypothetical protein
MPCGWKCGASFTTGDIREHMKVCPNRPIVPGDCTCKRCGYLWPARKLKPKECPNCKQRNWDRLSYGVGRPPKAAA